jgi:hypothetical protein
LKIKENLKPPQRPIRWEPVFPKAALENNPPPNPMQPADGDLERQREALARVASTPGDKQGVEI